MKRRLGGFTIIEVSLFLAITGLIFLGVTVGVQSSVFRQRFNDSTQNFAEFLRGIYAETTNVQSADSGRSGQAIYGKLVTFGETRSIEARNKATDGNTAYIYDVVGQANGDIGSGNILDALSKVGADVVIRSENKLAGIVESYSPKWSAQIQQACSGSSCSYTPIKAAILVVRHPRSGTVYTYVMNNATIEVNQKFQDTSSSILDTYLKNGSFKRDDLDFCINPEGSKEYSNRANVRIYAGARNSSAIEIINDVGTNRCRAS